MATLSKLLCAYVVIENVNDRLDIEDAAAATQTATITPGRYRDHIELAAAMITALDAATAGGTAQTWAVAVGDETGIITMSSSDTWDIDWNTGAYGEDLRDDLGFDGTETVSADTLTANNIHLGGFYPSEPVEMDDRPATTGGDRWTPDVFQQVGLTGMSATVGGDNRLYRRVIQFLLPQGDLADYSEWLERAMTVSFAYYHDREEAWDGPSGEYREYHIMIGESADSVGYNPERVEPSNNIWHRAELPLILRVAPTT